MSVWIIAVLASCALFVGAAAYRASGARTPRASRDITDSGRSRPVDDIDEYWGSAMPEGVAWHDEHLITPEEDEEQDDESHAEAPAQDADQDDDLDRVSLAETALGKRACRLGAAYLTQLLENNFLPTESRGECTRQDIRNALDCLKRGEPSSVLPHGAVAQRAGNEHAFYFEPFARQVDHLDNSLHQISTVAGLRKLHVIIPGAEHVEAEVTDHMDAVIERFSVPAKCLMVLQADGTFHSHVEDQAHFVPAQLDAHRVPETFVGSIFDYAQSRLDNNDPEAALRTLAPLAGVLYERVTVRGNFDHVLLAQILNLLGVANRAVSFGHEAVASFDSALGLLRAMEDYDSIQVVEANLGTTLMQFANGDAEALRASTRHLQNAVRLDQNDHHTWSALGDAFMARHEVERRYSLLSRAEHAYRQSRRIAPSRTLDDAIARVTELRAHRRTMELAASIERPSDVFTPVAPAPLAVEQSVDPSGKKRSA